MKKARIAPREDVITDSDIVLVGTYKARQLDWIKKNGIYNWPVREEDGTLGEGETLPTPRRDGRARTSAAPCGEDLSSALAKVHELWLYASVKAERHVFTAEYVGKMTNAEFRAAIELGDSFTLCSQWPPPTVIVSDGPYGLKSYPGDPPTPEGLADFYRPFLRRWHELSLPSTTLWFWNSEQGWANCHREIEACGWEFRNWSHCPFWPHG